MIYTSYFAVMDKLPSNITKIAISRVVPEWFKGLRYDKLAPTFGMLALAKNGRYDEYVEQYNDMLSRYDADDVADEIMDLTSFDDVCLLCYERPEKFCHRHLVSEWFNNNGYECSEYKYELG